jgi:hypothetical protein
MGLLISLLFGSLTAAWAQALPDAGSIRQQIEQPRALPPLPQTAPPRTAPPPEIKPPAGMTVRVKSFRFAGNTLLSAEQLSLTVAGFVGRNVGFEGLQRAADAVAPSYTPTISVGSGGIGRIYTGDFNGTVNASGANVTLNDVNNLTLGNVTATGNLAATAAADITLNGTVSANTLDLTATTGGINQTDGTLTVATGPTNLAAATDISLAKANDFNGTVNASGANVTLNDVNSLTLGNVNATGTLTATAAADINLTDTVNAASLSLTSTTGGISQTNGTLTTTTGTTHLTAATDISLVKANDFNGTVNASGANVTLNDVNNLTLGNVTATSNLAATAATDITLNGTMNAASLSLTATNGGIGQTAGTLTTTGPTNLTAATDISLAKANDFNGTVNASGVNVNLKDVSSIILGNVTAVDDLKVTSGGDISQDNSGDKKIVVDGNTDLTAAGRVVLDGKNNKLTKGVNVKAASYLVAGDNRKTASEAEAKAKGSLPTDDVAGTGLSNGNEPQPLTLSPGSSDTAAAAITPAATVDLSTAGKQDTPLKVTVAKSKSAGGAGFSFDLPDSVKSLAGPDTAIQITMSDGKPLPFWLKFDPLAMRLEASALPNNALPMQLLADVAGQRVPMEISE